MNLGKSSCRRTNKNNIIIFFLKLYQIIIFSIKGDVEHV